MSRGFLFALSLLASLSVLSAILFPVSAPLYYNGVEYDSRWQMFTASMLPTLEPLDFVYVKNVSGQAEVYASYGDGDIILFHSPVQPDWLIIHRAVEKFQSDGTWYFKTKGDSNPAADYWSIPEDDVIGKIVALSRVETVGSYNVTVFSSSAFTNFHLNLSLNALEFNVTVLLTQSAPYNFVNVTIPEGLLTGTVVVLVNGNIPDQEWRVANETHDIVWFLWEGTNCTVDIFLPEFPSVIMLPLLMILTLLVLASERKRLLKRTQDPSV